MTFGQYLITQGIDNVYNCKKKLRESNKQIYHKLPIWKLALTMVSIASPKMRGDSVSKQKFFTVDFQQRLVNIY